MWDRRTLEETVKAARRELERLEQEKRRTQAVLESLESFLGDGVMPTPDLGRARRVSMRGAVLDVIRSSKGKPMRTADILQRARAMGADTVAKKPSSIVALILDKERDVEKVAPATYVYRPGPK